MTVRGEVTIYAHLDCSYCRRRIEERHILTPHAILTGNATEMASYHYKAMVERVQMEAADGGWIVRDADVRCGPCRDQGVHAMSDRPIWMEDWEQERARVVMAGTFNAVLNQDQVLALFEDDATEGKAGYDWDCKRAKLAAAAPELVRVLVLLEWSDRSPDGDLRCPSCLSSWSENCDRLPVHEKGCRLDAVLDKCDLPHEIRSQVRAAIQANPWARP